jgi:hypothetical protein
MKRVSKKHLEGTEKIYHFFKWQRCNKCGMEFRREWGWRHRVRHLRNNFIDIYFCSGCCPKKEDVIITMFEMSRNKKWEATDADNS